MSKFLIITDTHIGARGSSKHFRQLFREYFIDILFPYIVKNNIETVIHAGDLFDNRSSVTLHDIHFINNEFIPAFEATGAHMYVIAGNHDVAYRNTNSISSLSLLERSRSFTTYMDDIAVIKGDKTNFVMCPWVNNENYEKLMEDLKHYADKDHVLVGHFEFQGMKMYANAKTCDHGIDPKEFKKFKKVFSGHFHHKSSLGNVEYLGSLFHLNWQDHGDWRGFRVYDTSNDKEELIENEFCLFTEFDFHEDDLVNMSKEDISNSCEGQIVRIVINKEYDRVELKDVLNKIERQKPIDVSVIDNTVVDFDTTQGYDKDDQKDLKSIEEYAEDFFKGPDQKLMLNLFKEVKEEAQQKMRTIE